MQRLVVIALVVIVATMNAQAQSIAELAGLYTCQILNEKQERIGDHTVFIDMLSDGTFNGITYDSPDSAASGYNAGEFKSDHSVSVPESDKHVLGYVKGRLKHVEGLVADEMEVELQMSSNNDFRKVDATLGTAIFPPGTGKHQGTRFIGMRTGQTELRCADIHLDSPPREQRQSATPTRSDDLGPLKTASIPKQAGTYMSLLPDGSDLPPMVIVVHPNGEILGITFQDQAQRKAAIQCNFRCSAANGLDRILGSLRYSDPNAMTHANHLIVDLSTLHLDYKGSAYFDLEGNGLMTVPDPGASASQSYPKIAWARIG
ncbi:MAG TPA: hypothetical protein VGC07_10265 [Granulicella sp.]